MEQIAIVSGGRVHGFAPFDPLRHIVTKGASFDMVTESAVMKQGCVGVKIYPPMGFAAYGNKYVKPNPWAGCAGLPAVAYEPNFGQKLDDAMSFFLDCDCELEQASHGAHQCQQRPDR